MCRLLNAVILLFLVSCTSNFVNSPITSTQGDIHASNQENMIKMKLDQLTQSKAQPIILTERDMSQEELDNRASFKLLWPTYLPPGFPFQRIGGFSVSSEEPVMSTDFMLHYGSGKDQWLTIQQSVSITSVKLTFYELLDQVPISGTTTPVYEQTSGKEGPTTILYFQFDGTTVYLHGLGMEKTEMLKVISNLEVR